MPLNQLKKYSELLELGHLNVKGRTESLQGIFNRDIVNNEIFKFRKKQIRPLKKDGEPDLQTLFNHLTTREEYTEKGEKTGKRTFEMTRSLRLHWIKYHIEELKEEKMDVFSYEDRIGSRNIIRTYIYDTVEKYVIILEPYRSGTDYYLLTAYYLNEKRGRKQIENKRKKRMDEVH